MELLEDQTAASPRGVEALSGDLVRDFWPAEWSPSPAYFRSGDAFIFGSAANAFILAFSADALSSASPLALYPRLRRWRNLRAGAGWSRSEEAIAASTA